MNGYQCMCIWYVHKRSCMLHVVGTFAVLATDRQPCVHARLVQFSGAVWLSAQCCQQHHHQHSKQHWLGALKHSISYSVSHHYNWQQWVPVKRWVQVRGRRTTGSPKNRNSMSLLRAWRCCRLSNNPQQCPVLWLLIVMLVWNYCWGTATEIFELHSMVKMNPEP